MAASISNIELSPKSKEQGFFIYGNNTIYYDVIRKPQPADNDKRQSRKVLIKVHPDQRVVATVPFFATENTIHEALLKRARWIWQSIDEFAKQKDTVLPKRYVSGETQFYLGKRYVLKVFVDHEQLSDVKLSHGRLNVTLDHDPHQSQESKQLKTKRLIEKWYQLRAKAIFEERLAELLKKTTWVKDKPSFRVMKMKKQWGSCSIKGNLMLNPHLVKAPKECIDYVILHELCHIAEHNHSEKFWRLLTQVMPHWKETKSKLDNMAEMYLNE